MITALKIFLGWRGTWFWACRQMMAGKTVYRLRDSGHVTFSYDHGIRKIKAMIEWETSTEPKEWGISMEDVFATDFMLVHENMDYAELHRQSQMKINDKPLKEGLTKRHIKKSGALVDMGPAPKPIKAFDINKSCFAQIIGNSTNHRFKIGTHVVVISVSDGFAYCKETNICIGENVLLQDLKDDIL